MYIGKIWVLRGQDVEFQLLGPVRVIRDGKPVGVGTRQQRFVLAVLALHPNQLVTVDRLIDLLWPDEPPPTARGIIHRHVSGLRAVLAPAGALTDAVSLRREGPGYLLACDPITIDAHRFIDLIGQARAEPDPGHQLRILNQALGLWRGPALADTTSEPIRGMLSRHLDEARLTATERRLAALLDLDRHDEAIPDLTRLAADHPDRHRVTELLMTALHRTGRTTDALTVYRNTKRRLAEDEGLDPPPQLQQLELAILRDQPAPAEPASRPTPAGPPHHVPRQLPAPPQLFTGRAVELADLDKIHDASTVVITAIDGMAGIGKTALAVHAAHQMIDRYPDGQLFIDLHGYTHGVAPVEPGEALDRMLRALGVPAERIPDDLDERAGLYRSRLADQRMLIVLDNAATETQVTPLLPGAPGCLVLVTSRRRLAGLDHTHTLSLDTLPLDDAVALLSQTAGESRPAGQPPEASAELVELCGRLPLAIRIAAARLRSHPTWDLSHLSQRLRNQQHRLVELAAGQRSVTAALDLSYQDLNADPQRTYRLLGLHPGPDIEPYATAALLDCTALEAGQLLEQLLESHLLQEPTPGRYWFHDLTRAHAAHTATRDETQHGRQTALDRLLDHYRHTAALAMDVAYPYDREHRPQVPPARTPSPALPDPEPALDWLDSELPNLLATARYATAHDRPAHLLHLSTILHRHLRNRGHYHDASTLHQQAMTTARATGDQAVEIEALTGLGHIHWLQGRYEQATDHFQQALRLARATGHQTAELNALTGLGNTHMLQSRYEQATDHYQHALQLARTTGDRGTEQTALVGLGSVHRMLGQYERAADHYQRAMRLARDTGHRPGELQALAGLGHIHRAQGRYQQAANQYQQALRLSRATGHRTGEQAALSGLGNIHRRQGQYEQATDHYQQLLDLANEYGSRNWQFEARQGLGRLQHATGHPDAALTDHQEALSLATELGHPDDQARAHDGLAHAHHAMHQYERARTHWQHALDILTRLGIDDTDDEETTVTAIRTHLANLDPNQTAAPTE
jgi:DNA-binding SARP family transcriptional activator/tetratricopeptide (TPR) repeat protein